MPFDMVPIDLVIPVMIDMDDMATPVAHLPSPQRFDDDEADPEKDAGSNVVFRQRETEWRIRRIRPDTVGDGTVIDGNIDNPGARGLDDDRLFPGRDHLLRGGCERSRSLRFAAQALHRIHDVALLRQEGVANLLHPIKPTVHHLQNLRKGDQRLHAGIPVLRLKCLGQLIAFERRVAGVLQPPGGLDHLEGIGGRCQDLREKRIGVESDGGQELVELRRRIRRGAFGQWRWRYGALRTRRQRSHHDQEAYGADYRSDQTHLHILLLTSFAAAPRNRCSHRIGKVQEHAAIRVDLRHTGDQRPEAERKAASKPYGGNNRN
jgi:hypothetical protein